VVEAAAIEIVGVVVPVATVMGAFPLTAVTVPTLPQQIPEAPAEE
jgi:hypothetical protein